MSTSLFVYGTLRSDAFSEPAGWLRAGATRLGLGRVRGHLVDLGAYPGLIRDEQGWVAGEVFTIDDRGLLPKLDHYEGCDQDPPLYRRTLTTVELTSGAVLRDVWVYEFAGPTDGLPVLESGRYPLLNDRPPARVAEP